MNKIWRYFGIAGICMMVLFASPAIGHEVEKDDLDIDGPELDGEQENASNPLAKVSNTDFRWQYFDLVNGKRINDFFIDGSFMATSKLKIKYELHHWETDLTGSSENDWEQLLLKAIYFAKQGMYNNGIKYRLAVGGDLIWDFGNKDKGIGSDADQIAPFVGIALGQPGGTTLIPLVQHFWSYSGADVNTTALRLIALQPLPKQTWFKLDAKIPVDWENDNNIPANTELQFGVNINETVALFTDGLFGIGGDRTFDWGFGLGLRLKY